MPKSFRHYFRDKSRSERIMLGISWALKASFFLTLIYGLYIGDYIIFLRGIIPLFVVLMPFLLEKYYDIVTPAFMDMMITLAFFLHQSGVVYGIYTIIPQFDMLTHFFSSVVLALSIAVFLYLLDANTEEIKLNAALIALFIVALTAMFGVVWEMGEALVDFLGILSTPAQESLADTMQDLSFDMLGSIFVASLFYYTSRLGVFQSNMAKTDTGVKRILRFHSGTSDIEESLLP